MKSFIAATLLAVASATSDDVTHPENTRVDIANSTKFIGRVGVSITFDDWVDQKEVDGALLDVNQNPCLFQWICADGVNKPFPYSEDEALYVQHNCPISLVHKIRFDTTLQNDNVLQYHTDDTVRRVDDSTDGQLVISSWIGEKRDLAEGETEYPLGNDDGFLFEGKEPAWSYAYNICLAGDDLSSEFCTRPDGGDGSSDPDDNSQKPQQNNCGLSEEDLQNAAFSDGFRGDFADYTVHCHTWPLEFGAVNQSAIALTLIEASSDDTKINQLTVTVANGQGEEIVTTLGEALEGDSISSANFGLVWDFLTYYTVGDAQTVVGVEGTTADWDFITLGTLSEHFIAFNIPDTTFGIKSLIWATKNSDNTLASFAPQIYE